MEAIIGADYSKKVVKYIDAAKRNIDIVSYDWRWYIDQPGHVVQQFNMAIVRAVKRGVQVRALLNTPQFVPQLNAVGVLARTLKDRRVLHSKMILIDETILIIGSHNLTRNAFGTNIEASLAVELPSGERRFHDFFNNLFGL